MQAKNITAITAITANTAITAITANTALSDELSSKGNHSTTENMT